MLSQEQIDGLEAAVWNACGEMTITPTTLAYAKDMVYAIVDRWQQAGEVPMKEYEVEVVLCPLQVVVK